MTCHECHWDNPINDPSGRLTLIGAPATYTPGARYSIIVDLARPELVLGGFQLSARFSGGSSGGPTRSPAPARRVGGAGGRRKWTYQLRPAHQGRRHRGKAGRRSMDAGVDRAFRRCPGDLPCRRQRGQRRRIPAWRLHLHHNCLVWRSAQSGEVEGRPGKGVGSLFPTSLLEEKTPDPFSVRAGSFRSGRTVAVTD